MLVGERSTVFVISFILVSFLAILTGRSKDQIVRMLAMRTSAKLQSSIFKKSMCFSCSARATNPLGSILSVSTHDMEFIRNYLIKVHDIWSGPLQLTVLFISAIRIIGIHGLVGQFCPYIPLSSSFLNNVNRLCCPTTFTLLPE